jgi:predicted nucleic acid-binding protein
MSTNHVSDKEAILDFIREGKITPSRGAEMMKMFYIDFIDILAEGMVPIFNYNPDDLEEDLKALEDMRQNKDPSEDDESPKGGIKVMSVKDQELVRRLQSKGLSRSNAETIALAIEQGPGIALIDEEPARTVAKQHGIKIASSIALIIQSKKEGYIKNVKESLDDLNRNGMLIAEPLYRKALELSGELEKEDK